MPAAKGQRAAAVLIAQNERESVQGGIDGRHFAFSA
jgi:hypothetical protein